MILPDRSTQSSSELILFKVWSSEVKKTSGVQYLVTKKLKHVTVKIVCARFRYHVDDAARIPAVLGVKSVRQDAKLLNGIRRRLDHRQVDELVVGLAPVHGVVVRTSATAVHRDDSRLVAAVEKVGTNLGLHSRLELEQLVSVARVQG